MAHSLSLAVGHEYLDAPSTLGSSTSNEDASPQTPAYDMDDVMPESKDDIRALSITSQKTNNECVVQVVEPVTQGEVAAANHPIVVPSVHVYITKWIGKSEDPMPIPSIFELICSWVGAFLGILLVAGLNHAVSPRIDLPLMVASFGASAVLVFGLPDAKVSQPRNFLGGQVLSAIVGCTVRLIFPDSLVWISAPTGMATALLVMQLTKTVHPPGGASALIAASALDLPRWDGYQFVFTCALGSVGMLIIAVVVNNISHKRHYPSFWF